jgi:glycolate oxidase FAD binding subunit
MPMTSSLEQQLAGIVGGQNLRAAAEADRVCGLLPRFVVEPETEQQLAAVLALANEAGLAVIPRGGGTKLDWGNPPSSADIILSSARLNRILEHAWADLTVAVEAGCTIAVLQETLAKHGQRLAVDVLWPERATVGGILSTADSGALRLRFGALRDHIIGITLALPDGTLASSGGKVVKNVAGYDLPKLATGALGTLGVITRAVFRLHPLPWMASTMTSVTCQASESRRLFAQILDSQLVYSALQVRTPDIGKPQAFFDILFEGTQEGIDAQIAHLQSQAAPLTFSLSDDTIWHARQHLHSRVLGENFSAVLKVSACPADLFPALMNLTTMANTLVNVRAVIQATGIGTVLFSGREKEVLYLASVFRKRMELAGGSLVALSPALLAEGFDAWGNSSDALPVMRALKDQLDPKSTLNPGRFVGGI